MKYPVTFITVVILIILNAIFAYNSGKLQPYVAILVSIFAGLASGLFVAWIRELEGLHKD